MTKQPQITAEDHDLMESWQADWNKFAREALGVRLDRQQRKILTDIQHSKKVSVRSGHSRGKDYDAAVASICCLYLNFPSKVINTAPTGRQVTSIMMAEISKIHRNAKVNLGGELLSNMIKFPDHSDWFLIGFKAGDKDHEAWTGFHSPNILVVVTEASGMPDETFNTIEGLLTGGNSKLLLVFNPNHTIGYAHDSTLSDDFVCHKLSCLDAPNVRAKKQLIPGQIDYDWVKSRIRAWCQEISANDFLPEMHDFKFEGKYYRPDDLFLPKVLGEFPREDSDTLIPRSWVEAAFDRHDKVNGGTDHSIHLLLGCDIAGMGVDSNIKTFRYDNHVSKQEQKSKSDHMATVGWIKSDINGNATALVDTIGEGAGIYSRLNELGVKCVSVKGSMKAERQLGNRKTKPLTDYYGEYEFANMRAYMHWALREALDPRIGYNLTLPRNNELLEELVNVKWDYTSTGKIKIEEKDKIKERIGRSPDKLDSLTLTFFPFIRSVGLNKIRKSSDKFNQTHASVADMNKSLANSSKWGSSTGIL
jgi:hypothetical protein